MSGGVPQEAHDRAVREYSLARSAVVAAEAELKTARGTVPAANGAVSVGGTGTVSLTAAEILVQRARLADSPVEVALELLAVGVKAPPGSAVDRLRGSLAKTVALSGAARPLAPAVADLFAKAGLDGLTARFPASAQADMVKDPPAVGPLAGEHTVAAWLQLMIDDFNRGVAAGRVLPGEQGTYDVYVRDYGLLVTRTDLAPRGALTVSEFARQVRAEGAAKAAAETKKP